LKERGKKELGFILKTGNKDDHFTILTDQEKLKQIITNLLENSVSFTDEGYIEFGYEQKDDLFLEFYIKDTGSGFSMERLELILERFEKVVDDRMRPFDTAALRINISKHLVKLLGGKLSAKSKLWEGSTFTFTLPLDEVDVHREEEVHVKKEVNIYSWDEKKILIAEDVESPPISSKNFRMFLTRPNSSSLSS
jgi:signal transduction histidine kinase